MKQQAAVLSTELWRTSSDEVTTLEHPLQSIYLLTLRHQSKSMFGITFRSSSINNLLRDRIAARDVTSRYQHERNQGVRSTNPTPPNVSRHHKRSLTNRTGSESSQRASLLLRRLPPEIRWQIWKLCLGGRTIHLRLGQSGQLHAIVCLSPRPELCDEYEVNYGGQYGCSRYGFYENGMPMGQLLSLLLSCKQMYGWFSSDIFLTDIS